MNNSRLAGKVRMKRLLTAGAVCNGEKQTDHFDLGINNFRQRVEEAEKMLK